MRAAALLAAGLGLVSLLAGLTVTIVAFRVGKGTVIRYGLPQLRSRLATDPDVQGLMTRSWQLLSR